jgi:putative Mn2+ efflux pump MntP
MTLLAASLFLSIDSLLVSFALAPVTPRLGRRVILASLFGLCDGGAVALGSVLKLAAWQHGAVEIAGPLALVAFGVYFLIGANWSRFRVNPLLAGVLPPLLGLDNLAYGAHAGGSSGSVAAQAVVLGFSSLALSLAGFAAHRVLAIKVREHALWFTGLALISCSAVAAVL